MLPNLKKNYLYRLFYEVVILISPLITAPYTARILGADGIGVYSCTLSIVAYFMLFAALGTSSYGAREIARNRKDKDLTSKLFWEIELMSFVTTAVCMTGWIILIAVTDKYSIFYLALTPYLLSTMFDISWFFTGLEMVKRIVIRNTAVRIISIICLFTLVRTKDDLIIYFLIRSGTSLLGNLSMWVYLPKMVSKVPFRSLHFRHHFHETLIYFVPAAATSIYTLLDKTLIGLMTEGTYQNGYYEQATKIIKLMKALVFVAINSVMGARLAFLFAEEKFDEIKRRIRKSFNYIYFLCYGAIFGILGISKTFVPIFLGKGYDPVVELLWLMAPLVLIIGTSNTLGRQYYNPSGQRKRSAKIIVLGALVNLVLNLFLIPRFEALGATIASVTAELLIAVLYIVKCSGYITWKYLWECTRKRLLAGLCMFLMLLGIERYVSLSPGVMLCIQVVSGVLCYCLILYVLKDSAIQDVLAFAKKKIHNRRKQS